MKEYAKYYLSDKIIEIEKKFDLSEKEAMDYFLELYLTGNLEIIYDKDILYGSS
ncbi:MAG: hypothetical protein HUJ68_10945 [Clostridia bacterium]|nr:hypothetical protein [Clostridia bacterium]